MINVNVNDKSGLRLGFILTEPLKGFSNQFLALFPERLSSVRIQSISTNSFADGVDRHVVRHDLSDMAILAITTADFVSRRNHCGPNRSRGSLRDRLKLKWRLPFSGELRVHLIDHLDHCLYLTRFQMAA